MNTQTDKLVIQQLTQEAFNMIFEGEMDNAHTVLSAVNRVNPGNRPSALGFAFINFMTAQRVGSCESMESGHHADPVMNCLQSLVWLKQGQTSEARILLDAVSQLQNSSAAQLARDIIHYEIEEGN